MLISFWRCSSLSWPDGGHWCYTGWEEWQFRFFFSPPCSAYRYTLPPSLSSLSSLFSLLSLLSPLSLSPLSPLSALSLSPLSPLFYHFTLFHFLSLIVISASNIQDGFYHNSSSHYVSQHKTQTVSCYHWWHVWSFSLTECTIGDGSWSLISYLQSDYCGSLCPGTRCIS